MSTKSIDLKLKISPEVDESKQKHLQQLLDQMQANVSLNLEVNDSALADAQEQMQALEEMLAGAIELDIDTGKAEKALEKLKTAAEKSMAPGGIDTKALADAFEQSEKQLKTFIAQEEKALAMMRSMGAEGSADYQKVSAGIDNAKKELDKFKATAGSVAAPEPSDTAKLAEAYVQAQKELKDYIDEQEKALAMMRVNGDEGTAEYKKIKQGIEDATGELSKFSEASKETAAPSFLENMAKFDAVKELGESLLSVAEKGNEVRSALKEVQAATGATAEEMASLQTNAEDAFRHGIGENLADAIRIAGTAQAVFKGILTPDDIKIFTQGAGAIGKAFGVETTEVIKQARPFIESFGLSGEHAFELIANAMQNARGTEILPILEEFSPLAKQAGYSAEEFVGILDKGFEKGVRNGEKLADSIKEAQIRLGAGDISSALVEIQSPITAAIQGIVAMGENGQKSVKDVLGESSQLIVKAFDAGQISKQTRDQLTVALSGSMAEEVGGQMWSEIFGAPIDTDAINAAAAKSAAEVKKAIEPVSLTDKFSKELELFEGKASAILAPIASNIGGALSGVSSIAPGLQLVIGNFGNLKEIALKLVPVAGAMWTAITGPIGLTILGIAAIAAALTYFFTQTSAGKEAFEQLTGYITSFVDNSGELFGAFIDYAKAVLDPTNWFSGDAIAKAGAKIGQAVDKMMKDGANNVKKSKLGEALTEAASLKGDLDKNNKLKGLIDKFKNSKDEAEKNSLAKAIQDQVPGALSGIKQVTDANGNISDTYDINVEKAQEFADAQDKAIGSGLKGKVDDFRAGIVSLSDEYDTNKAKLQDLADQMVTTANNGGDITELKKQYEDQKAAVDKSAEALGKAAAEGQKLGLAGEDVTKELHLSGDKAAIVAANVAAGKKKLDDASKSVETLSKHFADAKKQSDALVTALQGQMEGLKLKVQQGAIAPADAREQMKGLTKDILKASKEQDQLNTIAEDTAGLYIKATDKVQHHIDVENQRIDQAQAIRDIEKATLQLQQERDATTDDEIVSQAELIQTLQEKLSVIETTHGASLAQRRDLAKQAADMRAQIQVEQEKMPQLAIKAGLVLENLDKQVAKAQSELNLQVIQMDIGFGLATESDLLPELHKQLESAKAETVKWTELANNSVGELRDQYLLKAIDASNNELGLEQKIHETHNAATKRQFDLDQVALDNRHELVQKELDAETAMWSTFFDSLAAASTSAYDRIEADQMDALDKAQQAALDEISGVVPMITAEEQAKLDITKQFEEKKAALQEKYRKARAVADAEVAGMRIQQQDIADAAALRMQQENLQAQLDLAEATGDKMAALKLGQQLDGISKELLQKTTPLLELAGTLQTGMQDIFNNLVEGNDDAAKDSMRKVLATVGGFIEKLIDAAVIEMVLGSTPLKALAGTFGMFAPIMLTGFTSLVGAGVHALVNPILSSILSFSTGTRIDSPTLAVIGDGARLGGINREWLFRDDQLKAVLAEAVSGVKGALEARMASLEGAVSGQRVLGIVRGRDIVLVSRRADNDEKDRQVRL